MENMLKHSVFGHRSDETEETGIVSPVLYAGIEFYYRADFYGKKPAETRLRKIPKGHGLEIVVVTKSFKSLGPDTNDSSASRSDIVPSASHVSNT
jgi:aryl-alcohol dehydrogenase-like predicted oxidoreductase